MLAGFAPHLRGGFCFLAFGWALPVLPEERALDSNRRGMTFSHMLRDVLVASLHKGQFPVAIIGVIVIIAVLRMSPADLSRLVFRLLDAAETHEYGGYALSIVIALGWGLHSKRQQRQMMVEIKRLTEQRSGHQSDGRIEAGRRRR